MRLAVFLILLAVLQSNAGYVYSQASGLSLSFKTVKVEEVLLQIEKQSNYVFLYNKDLIDVEKKTSIDVKNAGVDEVLNLLFRGTGTSYKMMGRQIILSPAFSVQQKEVRGKITNEKGEPVPGASIVIKGTTRGTVTGADGAYTLSGLSDNSVLLYSFIGLKTQEITVGDKQEINVILQEDQRALDEVIVIGYGTARRQEYTGSASSVKIENSPIALIPNLNALESLKGNVSGLNIGATNSAGGQPSMGIRGQNSISGNNNPLIVLDGVIYLGSISDINPNDIATFDVLKDAVSAAAYGSRSANGVIAITTKKGKTEKPVIRFNTTGGVQFWQNRPVMMKGEEWIEVVNARNRYTPGTDNWAKSPLEIKNHEDGKEIVWLDEVTRTGVIQDYQIAISGSGRNVNYYVSSSYNANKGIIEGDDFDRMSLLTKTNTVITDWLKLGLDFSYSRRDYSGVSANVGEAQTMSPYGIMYRDDKGNLEKYPYGEAAVNPLWGVLDGSRENKDIRNNFRINAYAVVDVSWIKGLNFRLNFTESLDKNQSGNFYHESYYVKEGEDLARYDPVSLVGFLTNAHGNINNSSTFSYVVDNILNYNKTVAKHHIEATLVATRDYLRHEEVNSTGSDYASNGNTLLGIWGLHKATVQQIELDAEKLTNIGYLGRLSYSFDGKYFLTSSYRRDGASVFGANKKWSNFAAFGVAWRISDENFMKAFRPVNDLKLKLSWGQNGNQGVPPYGTLSKIVNGTSGEVWYEFSNAEGKINYGLYQSALGNSDLGWESTSSWNGGFESAWFNKRVFVDLDMYFSKTTDQLFVRDIPVMSGFKTIKTSMGQVNNKGLELTLHLTNVKTTDLTWKTSFTWWLNRNKLVKLYGEDKDNDGREDDDISGSLFIGKSLSAIYGYEQIGIVQEEDAEYIALTGAAPGAPKYRDLDHIDGITADDRKILGYGKENFRLNMSQQLEYKNLELYIMVGGIFGGNGYYQKSNTAAYMTAGTGRGNDNMTSKPYWTPENRSNVYPSAYFAGDGRYTALQSRGFIRLQDVSVSYTFDQAWVKRARINSLKLFVSAKNLATFTNWFGGDPEIGTTVRANILPIPSTYSIGADINF